MHGILLCLAVLSAFRRFVLDCDAVMDVAGTIYPFGMLSSVRISCWFPVGAVTGNQIEQERQLFSDPFYTVDPLSITRKSNQKPEKRIKDHGIYVSGNLSFGVTLFMTAATCYDAGVYRCRFFFQTLNNSTLVPYILENEARLDVYPERLTCRVEGAVVDFAQLAYNPVYFKADCEITTTLEQFSWAWEVKTNVSWQRIPPDKIISVTPPMMKRCKEPVVSMILFIIQPEDRNRHFRVYVVHRNGQSQVYGFSIKGINDKDADNEEETLDSFKDVLVATGWILLSMMIFVIIILALAHGLFPALLRVLRPWTTSGRRRELRPPSANQQGTGQPSHRQQQRRSENNQPQQLTTVAVAGTRTAADEGTVDPSNVNRSVSPVMSQTSLPNQHSVDISLDSPGAEAQMSFS